MKEKLFIYQTISMGQHQCPKCERQFARSDSLRRHLTSGICSEDMESETMSENEDSAMSEESDAETSRSHQKEDIFGKYTDKDYGIRDGSNTDCIDEDDEDQHYSRKKSKFDPWTFFVNGAHSILHDIFNEGVQHIIEKNPDIDTEEAEEETFDKLEPRYRAEAIGQYKAFLKLSKAMKKDPLHKKITDTAKRLQDEDEFDEDDALRYAIKKRRCLLDGKLEEFDPQPIPYVKMINQIHYNRVQDQNMHQVSCNRTTLDQDILKVNFRKGPESMLKTF